MSLVLNLVPVLKQRFNKLINGEKSNKSNKDIDIYYIGYIAIKKCEDSQNIYSVNSLYLINGKVDGHIEVKNEGK